MTLFNDRFAISGLGVTKQGRIPGVTVNAVRAEAARLAVEDAGLTGRDIGGLIYQVGIEEMINNSLFEPGDVAKRLGMAPNFIWRIEAGGVTCASAILSAMAAIDAGTADYVLCVYGSCDLSHLLNMAGDPDERSTEGAYGLFTPGAQQAMSVTRHMHLYGTTHDQLGAIAVTQRENANKRPDAFMHDRTMTLEDYHKARWIIAPYQKYDMCLINDGGIGLIVTSSERAKDLKSRPVHIMGIGLGVQLKQAYDKENFTTLDVATAKQAAFKTAGITLDDIDVAQLYDCFTGAVLFQTEDYGFCSKGEGGPFWENGHARVGGKIPINTSGGNLSWGYNQGFTPVAEAVRQLRGEGGETQVKDAEIALASGHGTNTTGMMEYGHSTIIMRR